MVIQKSEIVRLTSVHPEIRYFRPTTESAKIAIYGCAPTGQKPKSGGESNEEAKMHFNGYRHVGKYYFVRWLFDYDEIELHQTTN